MSKVDVVLGIQWGDEGKGKVVDVLTPQYKTICRFQGGPNAGHSLVFYGDSFVLHTVPSGIFRQDSINIIGNGVVIDPVILLDEIQEIEAKHGDITNKLQIAKKAHLILPTHRVLDAAIEASKGTQKVGTTGKGIGPTYTDKTGRNGLRVGDILSPDFKDLYLALKYQHCGLLDHYKFDFDITEYEIKWFEAIEALKRFTFVDCEHEINKQLDQDVPVLAEGAQGTMLDIDYGTYPYVTSSHTTSAGVCIGLGVAPNRIGKVMGIFKAYCTRVGSGPFPTELFDATGERLRNIGREYGATTGRPRRCGWLDLVALKYAVMMNGIQELIMMKADVMYGLETVRIATAYKIGKQVTVNFPFECPDNVEVIYKDFDGWGDISNARCYEDFHENFKRYIAFIEEQTGCKITIISVGPDREQTIFL